jgi:hypothetical protein
MSFVEVDGLMPSDAPGLARHRGALPAEVRAGDAGCAVRITDLSAAGVELEAASAAQLLPPEATIHIPSLGIYRARRLWRSGAKGAYLFDLTEFSRRALDALIRDRFPE